MVLIENSYRLQNAGKEMIMRMFFSVVSVAFATLILASSAFAECMICGSAYNPGSQSQPMFQIRGLQPQATIGGTAYGNAWAGASADGFDTATAAQATKAGELNVSSMINASLGGDYPNASALIKGNVWERLGTISTATAFGPKSASASAANALAAGASIDGLVGLTRPNLEVVAPSPSGD